MELQVQSNKPVQIQMFYGSVFKAPSALDKEDKTYQADVVIVGGGGVDQLHGCSLQGW